MHLNQMKSKISVLKFNFSRKTDQFKIALSNLFTLSYRLSLIILIVQISQQH